MRLTVKLMLLTAAVVLGAGVLMDAFFGRTLETFLIDHTRAGLVRQTRLAGLVVASRIVGSRPDKLADFVGDRLEVRVTLIDSTGMVIGDSQVDESDLRRLDNHGTRLEVVQARQGGFGRSIRFSDTMGIEMLYVAGSVPGQGGNILRLAIPTSELAASRRALQGALWLALLGSLAAVVAISYGITRLLTQHLNRLSEAVRRMADGDLDHRAEIGPLSTSEIRKLTSVLNEMRSGTQEQIEQVRDENSHIEAVLASISQGIMVTSQDGRIRMTNPQFARLFDPHGASDTAGLMPIELIRHPRVQDVVTETLATAEGRVLEISLPGILGRNLDVHAAPIILNGTCVGTVTVFYDITELRRLEQVRKDFVANVSHELRTPLTTIKGCAATLADGALEDPEAAQRFVDSINSHAERLHLLVDDLLDLSQLESGTLDVEPVPFNLRRVAAAALDTVKVLSAEKSIDVVNDVAPSLKLSGDPRLIQQALINLLDNAIKYTSAGGRVTVSAVSAEDRPTSGPGVPTASPAPTAGAALSEESGPRLAVEVSDNGPGIPSDDLPRIFERFYRVEKARSRALGGTGLGLSIVRHILEAHGERVYVRSELGRGTTFGFTLPISDGGY